MAPALRILDANLNRAREALRVLEDLTRFALGSAAMCEELKRLRHDLASLTPPAAALALLASRDTPDDVGTTITTSAELHRNNLEHVAIAAVKRLTEALRSIEEVLKVSSVRILYVAGSDFTSSSPSQVAEAVRYRAYDLERRLVLALSGAAAPQWSLCVLLTEGLCLAPWLDVARAALDGGADCLQLREKALDSAELLRRARALVDLTRRHGRAQVIINDRADIALLAGADGVHLGQTDLSVDDVRRLCIGQRRLLVGVSTHDLAEARAAADAGADYAGVGAMFSTGTKPREVSGPAYLRAYLADPQASRLPHLAIGGITPANIAQLAQTGARGVAVSSVVCGAPDPGAIVAQLREALRAGDA
jgi:thiamine-phosphate pyrophosphorylase